MDTLGRILYLVLSLIGAIASGWFLWEKLARWRRLPWRAAEKAAHRVADQLTGDRFDPALIVGIGRGGAIFGSMISGCLGHRPLLVIDRKYVWEEGRRIDDMILRLNLPEDFHSSVLLVAGEAHSGNTMRLYHQYFTNAGAKEVRRAAFFVQRGCTESIEYKGTESATDRRMPWMFCENYRRDSRSEEESKGLSGNRE